MKLKLFISAFFILIITIGHSQQTTIWSEDFNDEDLSEWTIINANGDTNQWGDITWTTHQYLDENWLPIDTPFLYGPSFTMFQGTGHLNPDDWAITPPIDLTGITLGELIELRWALVNHPSGMTPSPNGENYSIYIANSNDIVDLEAGGVLYNESNIPITYTLRSLDISAYAGQTVYIAFRQHDVDNSITPPLSSAIGIDDVAVLAGNLVGCLDDPNGQHPVATFIPMCNGLPEEITDSDGLTGQYSLIEVQNGLEYIFSTSNPSQYITIGDNNGQNVLASGLGSLSWTSSLTGSVRFYAFLDENCNWDTVTTVSRFVQCGEIDPEDLLCEDHQVLSNSFEDYFIFGGSTNQHLAVDIYVPVAHNFTLYGVEATLAGNASAIEVNFYNNSNGLPGTLVETIETVIFEEEDLGNGYTKYILAFDSEVALSGGNTYWMEIISDASGWEATTASALGEFAAGYNDNTGGNWAIINDYEFVYRLICDELLSVEDIDNSINITIYPNPVNDLLKIKAHSDINEITVYDALGKKILVKEVNSNNTHLYASVLKTGTYFLKINIDNKFYSYQVIKN
ncbi:T9SS-dependent choice-of-anchor J family protein [Gelidibacter japonicus]|uniref:T9SS-dependent choice-of-anchor J family protein n=1 Tax=Gelidibacter japonicus TaxID=1962232 RepID=UPI0013D19647|nr:T9SS type A sorting domain-containing protein [Gelidibacter japonicus]